MLKEMGRYLFEGKDPAELMFKGATVEIKKKGKDYVMVIPLPMVEKGDVDLLQKNDELIIKVGSFKRDIILPRTLVGMRTKSAKFEQDQLRITFSSDGEGKGK